MTTLDLRNCWKYCPTKVCFFPKVENIFLKILLCHPDKFGRNFLPKTHDAEDCQDCLIFHLLRKTKGLQKYNIYYIYCLCQYGVAFYWDLDGFHDGDRNIFLFMNIRITGKYNIMLMINYVCIIFFFIITMTTITHAHNKLCIQ